MKRALLTVAAFLLVAGAASAQVPPQSTWYWQLQGTVNTSHPAKVYDIDAADASASLVSGLHADGHTVIAYIDAGTWENWRSDASAFPVSVLGNNNGWPGERYLDVRSQIVRDLIAKRFDVAKSKGFDAIEPDNIDLYSARTGFNITKADAIAYDTWLADQAHSRGMTIALKNSSEIVKSVVNLFDFAIAEQCFDYQECPAYSPFIAQGKGVLIAEYTRTVKATWCTKAASLKMSLAFFNLDLNGKRYLLCP